MVERLTSRPSAVELLIAQQMVERLTVDMSTNKLIHPSASEHPNPLIISLYSTPLLLISHK
jgi:hypothetical protein